MTTGSSFCNITNKRLLGFDDFATRGFGYLRELNIISVRARFDVDGAFNTLLGLASGVADTVTVTGTSRVTDGNGNVMEIQNCAGGQSALFQNTSGVTYYVGARYIEVYEEIGINPQTGLTEYLSVREEVGEQDAPDLVTDNGNGTITFRVDSVCESGVSCAGRTVRVYMVNPEATTAAEAFEDLTVVWDGSNNKVTSVAAFGQTSVSTTASDYVVSMLGITVKRNTNLETSPDHMFIGTVEGAGIGVAPTVFDTTSQRLLKTFEDASQILFTPYGFITVTNVQEAIQQILDVYADEGTSGNGATYLGVNVVPFLNAAPSAGSTGYGIGNISDSTFSSDRDLQLVLQRIDNRLAARRAWTAVIANNSTKTIGDIVDANAGADAIKDLWTSLWTSTKGGTVFAQDGNYGVDVYGGTSSAYPWIVGETGAWGPTGVYPRFRLDAAATADMTPKGSFDRLLFDSAGSTYGWVFGPSCRFRDVAFQVGQVKFNCYVGTDSLHPGPTVDGAKVKDIDTGRTNINTAGLKLVGAGAGSNTKDLGVFDNVHVKTDDSPCLRIDDLGARPASNGIAAVTFRNSTFITTSTTHSACTIVDSDVVFEDCIFECPTSSTAPTINASGTGRVFFKRCKFISKELKAIYFYCAGGGFEDCEVYSGSGTTNTDPKVVEIIGGAQSTHVKNMNVLLEGSRGLSGDSPANALVTIGLGVGNVVVDGLTVRYESGVKIHKWDTIALNGSTTSSDEYNPVNSFKDVMLDVTGADWSVAISSDLMYLSGFGADYPRIKVDGVQLVGLDGRVTHDTTKPNMILARYADVRNVNFHVMAGTGSSGTWNAILLMEDGATVRDVNVQADYTGGTGDFAEFLIDIEGNDCELCGVRMDVVSMGLTYSLIQVQGSENHVSQVKVVDWPAAETVINNAGDRNTIRDVHLVNNSLVPTGAQLIAGGGTYSIFEGIHVWVGTNSTTAALVNVVGTRCIVDNYILRSTGGTALINSGADSITGDGLTIA